MIRGFFLGTTATVWGYGDSLSTLGDVTLGLVVASFVWDLVPDSARLRLRRHVTGKP